MRPRPAESRGPRDENWAAFPLTRLRPEQVAGAVFQAASLPTLGPQSPWYVRFATYTGRNDFVRRYGDTGEDEFAARGGTIPQRLLLMNGDLVSEKTKDDLFNASRRIADLAPDDRQGRRDRLPRRPDPPPHARGAGSLPRHGSAAATGQERKRPADRPLLDLAQQRPSSRGTTDPEPIPRYRLS